MPNVVKLTVAELKKLIAEEKAGLAGSMGDVEKEAKKTKEVEADDYAGSLEKDIDHLKAMKVKEAKLIKSLKKLRESMKQYSKRINEAKKRG